MKINSKEYWDTHIAEPKFGLRQKKYLELAGKGDSLIDFGCGVSPFLDKAREHFRYVMGVDHSPKTTKRASEKYPGIMYMTIDFIKDKHRFADNSVDVSVAGEVIEHLEDPKDFAYFIGRITKERIVISTALMEYDEPEHIQKFTKESLSKLFEPYGKVTVEEVDSKWFPGRKYLFLLCQK